MLNYSNCCVSDRLFGNRSFCFEKMQEYTKALVDAELSLSMCPGWVKGLFRKGRALAGLKVNKIISGWTNAVHDRLLMSANIVVWHADSCM